MASKLELMVEAERRGILPPDKAEILNEARKRGLVANDQIVKEKGFFGRVGEDLQKRESNIQNIKQITKRGEQTKIEGGLQQAGQTAGAYYDVIGEGLKSAGKTALSVIPDKIEEEFMAGAELLKDDPIIQFGYNALQQGAKAWGNFKKVHPRAARNIEASVNVGLFVTPVKKAKPGKSSIEKTSEKLGLAAKEQRGQNRSKFIQDLVMPEQTKAVRTEQVSRTKEVGLFQKKIVDPDKFQKSMIDEIKSIPRVGKDKTLQGNYNILSESVSKEAERLKGSLANTGVIFPKKEFNAALSRMKNKLKTDPLLVGDSEKTAQRLIAEYDKILDSVDMTPSGLLEARKRFDGYILKTKPQAFDASKENAFNSVIRGIRNTTNDFIAEKVPDKAVKASLAKQHRLLSAMDNIAPKAASEANNVLLRTWDNLASVIPIRNKLIQETAAVAGLGGLGAAAAFATPIRDLMAVGLVGYYGGKAVMSPQAKEILSTVLKHTDEAIKISRDKLLVGQLRADRAILAKALENSVFEDNQPATPEENLKQTKP